MGSTYVREFRRGADVIFAIDISRSMNIKDLDDMTRMERAVQISENLINAMPDGIQLRTGIALGKGNGILAVPISSDSEAALAILNALSSSIMSSRGTNLEKLVDAATDGFIESSPAGRQIVLLSDGEGLSGSLSAACERAKRKDITLIAVGIGSETGALVSENSSQDDKNTMIRSFLHRSTLKNAVERTGGSYIDGNSNSAEREIAEKIYPFAESSSWTYREESGSQWHIFLVAAIIFLSLSIGLTKSKR
jgi:Ca-activated chloride channel family protein